MAPPCIASILLLLPCWMSLCSAEHDHLHADVEHGAACGFVAPDTASLSRMQDEIGSGDTIDTIPNQASIVSSDPLCKGCITVETHVVVFECTEPLMGWPPATQSIVDHHMELVNARFRETPFIFDLKSTRFIVDDTYCRRFGVSEEDYSSYNEDILKQYRVGNYGSLNMIFGGGEGGWNFASYPYSVAVYQRLLPWLIPQTDGAFMGIYNLHSDPGTTVHEVRKIGATSLYSNSQGS